MHERSRDPRTVWGLLGLGLGLAACTAGMAILGDLRRHTLPLLGLYLAAFLPYGLAARVTVRRPARRWSRQRPASPTTGER